MSAAPQLSSAAARADLHPAHDGERSVLQAFGLHAVTCALRCKTGHQITSRYQGRLFELAEMFDQAQPGAGMFAAAQRFIEMARTSPEDAAKAFEAAVDAQIGLTRLTNKNADETLARIADEAEGDWRGRKDAGL